jgi:hypothetical protein
MAPAEPIAEIAHVVQLSIAPVFLLSAVGVMLGVLTNRMSRIIDRARSLEARVAGADATRAAGLQSELAVLGNRARLVNRAIRLFTLCALMIATVVIALFVAAFFRRDFSVLIGLIFIAAMITLCGGLISFLREITLATRHLRIGIGEAESRERVQP